MICRISFTSITFGVWLFVLYVIELSLPLEGTISKFFDCSVIVVFSSFRSLLAN